MKFPFEARFDDIRKSPDPYVDSVFSCLESEFMVLPKGPGFVEYPVFEQGYEALKRATTDFSTITPDRVMEVVLNVPVSFVVIRSILGFTPPELAYVASLRSGTKVTQNAARSLDRDFRMEPLAAIHPTSLTKTRIRALVETACALLAEGPGREEAGRIHRLRKADTGQGIPGVRNLSSLGVPYAMVLYERFLGRPFAGHRDSVSELIGDSMENAVENELAKSRISFRKTKRAEKVAGFDQAPDFIIPDEFHPQVIIEAKITEDDGTARDKATRIQHLGHLAMEGRKPSDPRYEVIACIGGRGFGVRREDMKRILIATRGKVFTFKTLTRMVDCTRLKAFCARKD